LPPRRKTVAVAVAVAVGLAGCGGATHAAGRPTVCGTTLGGGVPVVVPAPTIPASVGLPDAPWAASFDVRLGSGGVLAVGDGCMTVRTVRGRTGKWRHMELTGRNGGVLTLRTLHGTATVRSVVISGDSDAEGLLLQRLAEIHARIRPDQFPFGATRRDALNLSFSWTNGFWPGALWNAARLVDGTAARAMFTRWALVSTIAHLGHETAPTHDVGFLYGESSLAAWRAMCQARGAPAAAAAAAAHASLCARLRRSVLLAAGELIRLAASNPRRGTIPTNPTSAVAETIVDSMMNIQILPWATAQTGDAAYARLARHQADVIANLLVRRDGSTAQAVHFDRATGRIVFVGTHQGLSNTSTWSRGEGWALYGFAQLAAQLRDPGDLRVALRVARYVRTHLPPGGVPRWDYDAPAGAPVDVSAGVITAAGLLHLAAACRAVPGPCPRPAVWTALARRMLAASLRHLSRRPPIGYLGSQVTDERIRNCTCNGGELIYGLTYALEALALERGR
jgi:hypothetical protein